MINTEVHKAGKEVLSGGIILYPTDTIWGLGCDAQNRESIQRIYRIKQRADSKSMLVLVNSIAMLEKYVVSLPPEAMKVLEGAENPTTIIYPGARNLALNLLAPDGSIGIRISRDPFCKQLIEFTGKPIVSTSANISGDPSPALFSEIKSTILQEVDYVVKWRQDELSPAKPSVIIKLEKDGSITTLRS